MPYKIFSTRPIITRQGNVITIKPSFFKRLTWAFLYKRNVVINSGSCEVVFDEKWIFSDYKTTIVKFSELSHIDYDYDECVTSRGGWETGYRAEDSIETFTITLVTKSNEKHILCKLIGEGTGDYNELFGLNFAGTQEDDSRQLANSFAELLNIPIGRRYDFDYLTIECPNCGKSTAKANKKCLYCGAITSQME